MRISALLSLSIPFLATVLAAQQNVAWINDGNPTTGGANAFPWGGVSVRYQCIVSGASLPPGFAIVNDVLVAGQKNMPGREIDYSDIEIRMGITAQTTPTNSWTVNNPNPTVVYRGPLRTWFEPLAWRGIGLPQPYNFLPSATEPNLCVEVIVWGVNGASGNFYFPLAGDGVATPVARAYLLGWTTNQTGLPTVQTQTGNKMGLLLGDGNFVAVGSGCRGSGPSDLRIGGNGWPRAGMPFDVTLSGGAPSSAVFLALGASFTRFGGLSLPVDLGPAGAPGCFVWNEPSLLVPGVTNSAGAAKATLPIPTVTSFGRAYGMWINLDTAANALGITTSDAGKLVLGL